MSEGQIINPAKEGEGPFKCPACQNTNHAPLPAFSLINRENFSMIMAVHPGVHECVFCHTKLMLIIAPNAWQAPLLWVPAPQASGIVTPAQAGIKPS